MTNSRWAEIEAQRSPRQRPVPAETSERKALRLLTQTLEWPVLLTLLRREDWIATADSDGGDALGMARAAGSRTLLRRLERLEREMGEAPEPAE